MQMALIEHVTAVPFSGQAVGQFAGPRRGAENPVPEISVVSEPSLLLGFSRAKRKTNPTTKKMWVMTRVQTVGYSQLSLQDKLPKRHGVGV
jgi:hypothetical protein